MIYNVIKDTANGVYLEITVYINLHCRFFFNRTLKVLFPFLVNKRDANRKILLP